MCVGGRIWNIFASPTSFSIHFGGAHFYYTIKISFTGNTLKSQNVTKINFKKVVYLDYSKWTKLDIFNLNPLGYLDFSYFKLSNLDSS